MVTKIRRVSRARKNRHAGWAGCNRWTKLFKRRGRRHAGKASCFRAMGMVWA